MNCLQQPRYKIAVTQVSLGFMQLSVMDAASEVRLQPRRLSFILLNAMLTLQLTANLESVSHFQNNRTCRQIPSHASHQFKHFILGLLIIVLRAFCHVLKNGSQSTVSQFSAANIILLKQLFCRLHQRGGSTRRRLQRNISRYYATSGQLSQAMIP